MIASEQVSNPSQQNSSPQPANTPISQQQSDDASSLVQESTQGKKSNKWLIIGVMAFALVALGIAGYFVCQNCQLKKQVEKPNPSPEIIPAKVPQSTSTSIIPAPSPISTSDSTANWEIYRNEENNFEFKYPGDWSLFSENKRITIEKEDKTQQELSSELKTISGKANYPVYKISIFIEDNPQNYSIEKYYLNKYKKTPEEFAKSIFPENFLEEVIISGVKGIKYQGAGSPVNSIIVNLTYNYKYFNFNYTALTGNEETKDKFLFIFDQILSNFKFTN